MRSRLFILNTKLENVDCSEDLSLPSELAIGKNKKRINDGFLMKMFSYFENLQLSEAGCSLPGLTRGGTAREDNSLS